MPTAPNEPVLQVAEDIYRVQIPLPFALRIVNCYVIRARDGWTIVDTGINTPAGREAWRQAFAHLDLHPNQIQRIILTHTHPDHFGLAGWLQSLADAAPPPLYLAEEEQRQFDLFKSLTSIASFETWLTEAGMPSEMAHSVAKGIKSTRDMTLPHPTNHHFLVPDMRFTVGERAFRLIHAPGHSDGQLLLYDEEDRLLLNGDHVLMKITPNIGLWTTTRPDPLGRFMASLETLQALDVRLALPGHRGLITDWGGRLQELLAHHEQRLIHTRQALADGLNTAYEIAPRLFPIERFTHHEWRFAIAEALAHLEYLRERGQVSRTATGYALSS